MVNDIADTSFWDKIPFLKPYALLARWDRPIGFWLLFWPCAWGMALAPGFVAMAFQDKVFYMLLFLVGSIAMRGAGCTLNDVYDRKLDAQVARTKTRPLASGRIKPWQAILFLLLQLGVGAVILVQLPPLARVLGLATLPVIALYPLAKRFVKWPQFVLAIIFASGALIGWAAVEPVVTLPAILLYIAGICWVVGYDTVYAQMDSMDDAVIGIKSTALWWGPYAKTVTGWLWVGMAVFFVAALASSGNAIWQSYVMTGIGFVVLLTAHSFWPVEKDAYSLRFFRMQHRIGLVLALAALAKVLF